jgi:hypothetical protein
MKRVLRVMLASIVVSAVICFDAPLHSINGWVHQAGTEFEALDLLKFFPSDWHAWKLFGSPQCFGYCPEWEGSL